MCSGTHNWKTPDIPGKWNGSECSIWASLSRWSFRNTCLCGTSSNSARIAFMDVEFCRVTGLSGSSVNCSYCYDDSGGDYDC